MSVRDIAYIAGDNVFTPPTPGNGYTPSGVGIANKFIIPESLNLTNKLTCANSAFYLMCCEYMASIDAIFYGGNDLLCMIRRGHAEDLFTAAGFTASTYITAMKYVDMGANGRVLLVGSSNGKLMSTTDGINWTDRSALLSPTGLTWGSSPVNTIAYDATNGYYLIGGNTVDANQTRLVKVTPGDPWTSANLADDFMTALGFENDIMSLDFDSVNGVFLIGTSDGDLVLYRDATGFEVSANYTADVILVVRYSSVLGKFAIGCQNRLLYTYEYDTLVDISAGLTTLGFEAGDNVYTIRDLQTEGRIIIGGGGDSVIQSPRIGKFNGASEWTKYGTYLRGFDNDHSVVKDISVKTAAEIEDDLEGALQYRIILLDKSNTRKEIITNKVDKFEWSYDQWGGCGTFECSAKEELDSSSELWNITEGWQVQLWILGYQNTWELRYAGYINKKSTYLSGGGLEFEGDGFSNHLSRINCNKHFTATTVAVAIKYILDNYVLPYSPITYDNNQIQGAATVTDIWFRGTALDAIKTLALLQGNTDWGVDANKKFYFKSSSANVGKVLIQQKDIEILNIIQDFDHIYNNVTVLRGFTDGVFNIGAEESSNYSNGASITSYDRREKISLLGSLLSAADSLAIATNLTTIAKDIWKTKQLEAKPVEIIDWIEFIQPIGLIRIFSPGMLTAEDEEVETVRYALKGDAITMSMQLGKPESEAVGGMSVLEEKVDGLFDILRQMRNSNGFKIHGTSPYLKVISSNGPEAQLLADTNGAHLKGKVLVDGALTEVAIIKLIPNAGAGVKGVALVGADGTALQLPSLTTTQRDAIDTPPNGLIIHNSTTNAINIRVNGAWSIMIDKTYADGLVVGLLDDRGNYDASGNVFPSTGGSGTAGAILKGDLWYISVAGVLGGVAVNVGDSLRALTDTPGQTAGNWDVLESNIGYVPENAANKVTAFSTPTDVQYPSAKLTSDQLALKVNNTGNETIAGIKTFSSSPIVPTPTTDYQASTKKYVDDNTPAEVFQIFAAAGGANESFTLTNPYTLGNNSLHVYRNGKLVPSTKGMTEVDTTHFTLAVTVAGEEITAIIVTVLSSVQGIILYTAGDYLEKYADTEGAHNYNTPTKVKEIQIAYPGTLRIKFDLRDLVAGNSVSGQIYKNGVAVGTLRTTILDTYTNYSEDISGWQAGDLCQLYITSIAATAYWRNFRLYSGTITASVVNLDT